jgi:tetratricopeptide (TPR) repeat protein
VADAAARRAPDTVAWLAAEAKARPADYAPALLHGDALRMANAPDSDCVAPFAQAVALLAKRPDATRTGLFVRAVAADGLGLALTGSGKAAEAVPHLQRALDAATRLASPLRGRFAYNLACGLARKGDAAKAIDALRLAIEANHESRAAAVRDDDLVSLRALPAFQLLTAPVDETPPRDTAIARIPNSGTWITFRAPGWKDLSDEIPALADQLGPNAVALGSVGDARLFVIAVPDEPHRSSAESRSAVFGDKGMQFDAGEVACLEVAPGTYFGFPVAGGLVLRVALGSGDKPVPRDAFAAIVQSVRVWRLTAGTSAEYPPAVLDCMGGVAARMPTEWRAWLDAESKARPDDWVPCFVFAETCSELRLPAADVIAPYTKALALLDAKKDASRGAVFVRMLCEDNLGGVCAEAGKFADAVLHAQRANDAAASIGSGIHGEIALRLARWQARKGDAAKALTALRTALETQPELRERVAASSDFALLKSDAAFQALVAPPPK